MGRVGFDQSGLIGRGGEVLVYAGKFRGQRDVIREATKPGFKYLFYCVDDFSC